VQPAERRDSVNGQFLSVYDVTVKIKKLLDTSAALQNVWVRAEISNFKKHSRGHMYFTLKDDRSRLQSVMFAGSNKSLRFTPENGMGVLVRGDISVYEPFGQYQFYVKEMQPDGIGDLYLAFEQLKKKLEAAGYFEESRKKPLPRIPERIAVVTSPTGAAVRDIVTTLRRRYPLAKVTLLPVLVQGPHASGSISRAVRQADDTGIFDVMIVGRGGGSLEELWAFNEEAVAKAVFESQTPVVSAVGHETDVTISDFTADLRAPTPTAAAEMVVPDIQEMRAFTTERHARLQRIMNQYAKQAGDHLKRLENSYAFKYPKKLLEEKEQQLDMMQERLKRSLKQASQEQQQRLQLWHERLKNVHPEKQMAVQREKAEQLEKSLVHTMELLMKNKNQQLSMQVSKLDLLSPLQLMKKGYSLVYNEEKSLIKSIEDTYEGGAVTIRLQDGSLDCTVKKQVQEERKGL
jgi:exodeoxyribonuclease VII large subunit